MKYPYKFPPEYQHPVEIALTEAELKFHEVTKNLGRARTGFGRSAGTKWDEQAYLVVESLLLAFASQCVRLGEEQDVLIGEVRRMVDDFFPLIIEYVYFGLMPEEERSRDWKRFKKTAEERVRCSRDFEQHLEAVINLRSPGGFLPPGAKVTQVHPPNPTPPGSDRETTSQPTNAWLLKRWMDFVEEETRHRPDETELYTQAKVSRGSMSNWKKGTAGDKVHKAITDTMAKNWNWPKLKGGWTVTIHVVLSILPSTIS